MAHLADGNDVHAHDRQLAAAMAGLAPAELDALVVGPSADLQYLTGYDAPALTRLTALVVNASQTTLVTPRLEYDRAVAAGLDQLAELRSWDETDDAIGVLADVLKGSEQIGVADRFWSRFLLPLQQRHRAQWVSGQPLLGHLRARKTPGEIDALRRAGQAIDRVHARMAEFLAPGRTENEAARDIARAIVEEGHEEVNFVIVGSGPNGASPHHVSSDRRLSVDEPIVIDIGGRVDGYCSDSTRNYVFGAPPADYAALHELLERAQQAAVAAVRPGVTASSIDAAARDIIAAEGHGALFVHRTGHGIGLDEHEDPYIIDGNDTVLEPGMAFSIEPGLYLEGRFGMRLEDIVVVTDDGVENLNLRPRGVTAL